jgi:tRNA 2-thiouridine synthesizing protein E
MTTTDTQAFEAAVLTRLDAMAGELAALRERQRSQEALVDAVMPIVKEMMQSAVAPLDALDKQGVFRFGRELLRVGERVVKGYGPEDVRAFGDAVVGILDTVRTLTQPEVLALASDAGRVIQHAEDVAPVGLIGMMRAARGDDVQRGMAIMLEVVRHVGRAAEAVKREQETRPEAQKHTRLRELTAARKRPAPAPARPPAPGTARAQELVQGASCGAPQAGAALPDWTPALALGLAAAESLSLDDARFKVIDFARADFAAQGVSPNIRRITQGTGLTTKELYALFPKAPARTVAKIAGLPKPAGCI